MILTFILKLIFNTYFQALVIVLFLLGMVCVYEKAKASRKTFKCPNCGEKINVEFMKAQNCNVCGCNLDETALANNEND